MSEPSRIIIGDVIDGLRSLDAGSVHCCVTSPPYWGLRDYGVDGQIGLEKTPEEFVAKMVEVFREVRRVLRDDGTLFLNLGDSYAGSSTGADMPPEPGHTREDNGRVKTGNGENKHRRPSSGLKPKDLCMIPWRVALALQADGWWLRSVICWAKKSPMPESVTDRPTSSWEPIFLLAKSERYFYDAEAVKEAFADERMGNPGAYKWAYGEGVKKGKGGSSLLKEDGSVEGWNVDGKVTGRNQRNVWHLGPEPYAEAHFATFPTEIPRRAIKAGTSEKGCCAACGGPWRRVVEKSVYLQSGPRDTGKGLNSMDNRGAYPRATVSAETLGWEPTCTCGAGVVPCVVLEPFLGSGTSIAVARELGRHGVGIELNPEYAKLARDRIGKAERPATFRSDRVVDSPLFGGEA